MRHPGEPSAGQPRPQEGRLSPSARRNLVAALVAAVTAACLGSTFFFSKGTQFLMPGPLASAHGAIEKCSACHTKSGSGKLTWTHGLVAGEPLADSQACLTCHQMPQTAFNAHSASKEVLQESTKRLTKTASKVPGTTVGALAERCISGGRRARSRALLRDLPPGAPRCRLRLDQDLG